MALQLREWLHDRSTVDARAVQALNRGLPKGVGWLNTLGTAAVALLALQVITGITLAMYYSPHPDAAYETTQFIDRNLPMGRFVRGLHKYGDSVLIVLVVMHLVRTYIQAAYKPPRELIWISGILFLTLIIGFGFTGALLPWDQNAYYSTRVRTQYAGDLPLVGPAMMQLLRGGPDIGAMTITRFYAIHAMLLPALVLPLLVAHLMLAWRKGPTPPGVPVGEAAPKTTRMLDHQLFKNAVVIFLVVAVVYALAWFRPAELEFKANPSDATYQPRAEWYFLFLFQLVKDFGQIPGLGKISWIPVAVLPGIAITFLLLAPWIDRGPERRASRRPLMMAALALGALVVVGLTVRAYAVLHPNATPGNSLYGAFTDGGEQDLDRALVARGRRLFNSTTIGAPCAACHKAYGDYNAEAGPDLSGYGLRTFLTDVPGHPEVGRLSFYDRYATYVRGDIRPKNEKGESTSKMPLYPPEQLSNEELRAIGAYLSQDPAKPIITHANPRQR